MKDNRVRYNQAERSAIQRLAVRCFCLSRRDLTGEQMAERFLANLDAIVDACARAEGPFVYGVHANRIERLQLT